MAQVNNTALVNKRNEVRDLIQSCSKQISAALPKHMTTERMVRIAYSACQRTPKLLECTKGSIALSIINAAELGLEPNVLGHAYLVPYGTTCTLIPGYKGLLKLARNSGDLIDVQADVVREGDFFEYEKGLDPKLRHIPLIDGSDDRKITHFYCVFHLKNGGRQFEVMTKTQVDAIRKRSKAANNGPWVTDYEAMGLKTVAKRGLKWVPCSSELERAISLDNSAEAGLPQTNEMVDIGPVEEIDPNETGAGASISKKLEAKASKPAELVIPPAGTPEFKAAAEALTDDQRDKFDVTYRDALGEGDAPDDAHAKAFKAATGIVD